MIFQLIRKIHTLKPISALNQMDPCGICCVLLTYLCIIYAYYVIVGVLIVPLMNETVWGCLNGFIFTILVFFSITCHLRASLSNPGYLALSRVSIDFSDLHTQNNDEKNIRLRDGQTVCSKCEIYRPADSYHCRICRRCIKKRHHHCQWINNCIGELNQKYFIQFVFYIAISSIYSICFVMGSLIMYPEESLTSIKSSPSTRIYHSVFVIVECVIFGIFVFAIMCEQISSILSTNNNSNSANGIQSNNLPVQDDQISQNIEPNFFQNTALMNIKKTSYSNYVLFRRVFQTDNPLLWLLPIEFDNISSNKFTKLKTTQQNYDV